AYLMTFKCFNGFGVYLIAEEGFAPAGVNDATVADGATITVNGTVITVSEEASEITIVNLAGQTISTAHNATEIAAPAAGAYIVKAIVAGAPVIKKVVL
ncbi:MAG: T9SS type A sorting domain-containing protein, partial [Muribaculaceae bacterium]